MRWLRYGLLTLLALVFAASAALSSYRHASDMKQLITLQKSGAWALSELDRELRGFLYITELAGLAARGSDQVVLKYDLLWSRLKTLQSGRETREIRELPRANQVILELELALRKVEEMVLTLDPGNDEQAARIVEHFSAVRRLTQDLRIEGFQQQASRAWEPMVFGMAPSFVVSLAGLLISGLALSILLLHEGVQRRRQATVDELTGVPNRRYFNQQLIQIGARTRRSNGRAALLLINLDAFKEINESFGHNAGDELLRAVASRLRAAVREEEVIARVGGDEFAILQEGVENFEQASVLAQRVIEFLSQPLQINDHEVLVSVSMGVSFYPDDGDEVSTVLAHAGTALLLAKQDSGSSYRLYEAEMDAAAQRRKRLAEDLREALEGHQLALFYQPVVSLEQGHLVCVEALLRWHHPQLGYVPPPEVVSIAEQFGLALALNNWVLEEACRQNRVWQERGLPPMRVWVNISPAMYTRHDLVASVIQALARADLDASGLGIEVTEDTTMRDIETSPGILKQLQELGVALALDDFGTGYSSLSHLKRLPVNRLKIDRSFISDLNNQPSDLRFIQTLLSLAAQLDMEVVAEGIENQHQLRALRNERCGYGQGYLFSRPVTAVDLETLVRDNSAGKPVRSSVVLVEDAYPTTTVSSGSEDESGYRSQSSTARH